MEAAKSDGARLRKALSWCLALVLCIQMLGTSGLRAFAYEASDLAAAAGLGKNLVYDDVYGVKDDGLALMVKQGSVSMGANNVQMVVQADLVNSSGKVLTSFGMDNAPSSAASEYDKANYVSEALSSMERLLGGEFSYYCVPKSVGDKLKYGFAGKDGNVVASPLYDSFAKTTVGELAVAALDPDGSVVDFYDAGGSKTASISMPAGWSEGWSEGPHARIWFSTGEKSSLILNLNGRTSDGGYASDNYIWDSASNSFVAKEANPPSPAATERVWDLPDGGKVTIAEVEVDGRKACTCTTPQGSFTVNDGAYLWQFDVFVEEGLIQRSWNGIARVWDLSCNEVTAFEGAALDDYLGDGLFLCSQNSSEGRSCSIRHADGTMVKALPGTGSYSFKAPFVYGSDGDGSYVVFDASGNEVKKIALSSKSKTMSLSESVVEGVLVAIESERERPSRTALTAYDKTSGEWLSADAATKYARASRTTLPDGSAAYRIPVYDSDDGALYPSGADPVYYQYVDRDLNVLSQSADSRWISSQQIQRELADGTVMRYTVNDAGKYGAVDAEGEALIPFEYDAYYDCGDHESLILLKKDGAWEFFDTSTIDTKKEPVPATSVTISGAPEQLAVGATAQLTAAVEPENSTDKVMWATSDESVLTVDASGKVTAVANGKATVTAAAGDKSDSVEIAVTTPATSVTIAGAPEKPLNVGATAQLTATVEPEGSTDKATWASSKENVLTVDADGLVTALANGEATVTATAGEQTASVVVTVVTPATGITLDAAALTLYVGDKPSQLEATVLPASASNKGVAWTSSKSDVATVDDNGAVTPVGVGTCAITATALDGGFAATCEVTVGEHVSGVKLDKSEASIVGAGTTQLAATVSPGGALDKSVAWSTDDESVATVDDNGLVTAVGKGTAVVTATSLENEQQSASCTVTVSNPVTGFDLSAASVALVKGGEQAVDVAARGALPGAVDDYDTTLSVEGEGSFSNGVWSDASGNAVFAVEAGEGGDYTITALGTGKGTLVFEAQQGASTVRGVVAVSVTNPAKAVRLDAASKQLAVDEDPFTLTATVDPLDADEAGSIVWSTSNAAVATVEGGKVTPVSAGSAEITAKVGDVSAICKVTVTAKQIASTEDDSAFRASVEATDSAVAEQLNQIAQENGGALSLAVQGAEGLTDEAQQAVASLQGSKAKVAEVLDVSFRKSDGKEVPVNLGSGLMTVRVRMTDAMRALDPTTLQVSHVADDGTIEKKSTWVDGDDLCFATEHFSTYVVTGDERQTSGGGSIGGGETVVPGGGGNGGSSCPADTTKPLLAPTGDTLALPAALAGCAVAAALACLAFVRSGRRMR